MTAQQAAGGITRRSFLKAASTAAGVAAIGASTPFAMKALAVDYDTASQASSGEEVYCGACRGNCAGGCFLNIHVRDGHIVRTSMREMPDPRYNRICVKGLTQPLRVYSEERLKYPLRRVGERGGEEWERISWDDALNEIAEKYNGYMEEFGPTSIGLLSGSGNYAIANGMAVGGVTSRFLACSGIANLNQTVDAAALFGMSRHIGSGLYGSGNEPADMFNSKVILIWGANPAISQIQNMHFLLDAKEQGTKLIDIDPMLSQTAARCDQWVPIKSGTDGALALGMMNYIVEQGWEDRDFLMNYSDAPCLVNTATGKFLRQGDLDGTPISVADAKDAKTALVMGQDGATGALGTIENPVMEGEFQVGSFTVKPAFQVLLDRINEYPVDRAAELTGVDADTIRDVAEQYACNKPAAIYTFFGIDHYWNGHWSQGCLSTLACLTGNVGKHGAFCGFQEDLGTGLGNAAVGSPKGAPGSCATYNVPYFTKAFDEGEYAGKPFNLKMVIFSHTNTVTNMANRNDTVSWMNRCEFLVGMDIAMTDTMRMCDIVLPVAHWFEMDDAFVSYATHPFILQQQKAADPAFESRPSLDIFNDLADRVGCGELFHITTEEYLSQFLSGPNCERAGVTYETLKQEHALRQAGTDDEPYVHAKNWVFSTGSKLAEPYVENPTASNPYPEGWDMSKEHVAYWEPALQVGNEERRKTYPIQLLSEHSRFRTHTQWFDVKILKEIDPEPHIKLSPEDAEAYGIKAGDRVRAYNELGSVVLTAQINPGLPQGMATCPKGWEAHEFIEGSFTELFTNETNPFCSNQAFFDCTVAIEKA